MRCCGGERRKVRRRFGSFLLSTNPHSKSLPGKFVQRRQDRSHALNRVKTDTLDVTPCHASRALPIPKEKNTIAIRKISAHFPFLNHFFIGVVTNVWCPSSVGHPNLHCLIILSVNCSFRSASVAVLTLASVITTVTTAVVGISVFLSPATFLLPPHPENSSEAGQTSSNT